MPPVSTTMLESGGTPSRNDAATAVQVSDFETNGGPRTVVVVKPPAGEVACAGLVLLGLGLSTNTPVE